MCSELPDLPGLEMIINRTEAAQAITRKGGKRSKRKRSEEPEKNGRAELFHPTKNVKELILLDKG